MVAVSSELNSVRGGGADRDVGTLRGDRLSLCPAPGVHLRCQSLLFCWTCWWHSGVRVRRVRAISKCRGGWERETLMSK